MFKFSTEKKSWQAKLINRNKIINNINFLMEGYNTFQRNRYNI